MTKVIGEIVPPVYKDPAQMLRNLADEIDRGDFPRVETICVALMCESGVEIFGGGKDSGMQHCAFVMAVAHQRLIGCSV